MFAPLMKENNLMLPSESLSEYEKHGFFYIKGLFSKEELQPQTVTVKYLTNKDWNMKIQ